MEILKGELQKLGLSEKEARVYLAGLALGATPVQRIAERADVNRATTYVIIESLKKRGLFSSGKNGKKSLFSANHPHSLIAFIEREIALLHEKKEMLAGLVPQLQAVLEPVAEEAN